MAGAGLARFDARGRLVWVDPLLGDSSGRSAGNPDSGVAGLLDGMLARGSFVDPDGRGGASLAATLAAGGGVLLRGGAAPWEDGWFAFALSETADGGSVLSTVRVPLPTAAAGPAAAGRAADAALLAQARSIRDRHALLETVFDTLSDAVCAVDRARRLMVWNRPYADLFGLPPELLRAGTPFEDLIRAILGDGDDGRGAADDLEAAAADRVAMTRHGDGFDYRFRRPDGTVIDARHRPLPEGGFLRRFTDVTDRARAEEAQRAILEAIAVPLVVTRLVDGLLILGNQPAADFFGVDIIASTGVVRAAEVYLDPSDRARMLERLRAGNGRVDGFETRMRAAGGREAWVLLSVRAFRYHGEDSILTCVNDISERKRAEQDLEAQWSQSRAVLEGLGQGVMAFDREHRLIAWNRRIIELVGVDPAFARFHQPLAEIVGHVAARDDHRAGLLDEVVAPVTGSRPRRGERQLPDGRILELLTQALPDGGFVTACTDITARKAAERELADSRELFELAIRAAREGISQWNVASGKVWFSPQWWALLGYGENEAENTLERWSALILPEDRDVSLQVAADYAAGRIDDCQLVQRFRHKRGHTVYLYTRAVKVTDDSGRAVRLIGSHTDITERIRAEEAVRNAKDEAERALHDLKEAQAHLIQSEKMAALGSLVAGVAHEINTPVGIALTGASLLAERTEAIRRAVEAGQLRRADFADFLDTASEVSQLMLMNVDRAAQLIQSFKQMAVDQASEERRVFDLRDYIHEVLRSLGVRLRRAAHTVEVECPDDLVVDSYPGALSQVLTNFVMNSIAHAYAPGASGRLRITVRCPTADEVELLYSDDGKGIPQELHAKVFEPFFTTSRGSGGSGLGLNIVYNVVTRTLKGRITLDSAPGRGTTFILRFPRTIAEEGVAA